MQAHGQPVGCPGANGSRAQSSVLCGAIPVTTRGIALRAPVGRGPVDQHDEPVAKADQEVDVREQPEQPGEAAAEPRCARQGVRGPPPRRCGRWWPGCRSRGSGTAGVGLPRRRRRMFARGVPAHLLGGGRHAGHRRGSCRARGSGRGQVADDADLRMAGQAQVRLHQHAAGAVHLRAGACASWRPSGEAATPAAQMTQRLAMRYGAPSAGCTCSAARRRSPSRAHRCAPRRPAAPAAARALALSASGMACSTRGAAFEQQDARAAPGRCGGTRRGKRVARDLRQRAGHLDAGRAAADHDEREPGGAPAGVRLASRPLSKASSTRRRISKASSSVFRPGATRRPLVVAEVAVRGAGGDDEVVVGERLAVGQLHRGARRIDGRHFAQQRGRRWPACGTGGAPAPRSRAPTARRWPPGRAAAGTGGGWCGRPA